MEKWKKNRNYLVLNNYKPTDKELKMIDFDNSYIDINWKNTKTIQEFNRNFFKGNMNFIKAGSIISIKKPTNNSSWDNKGLKGDSYKSWYSVNFGYLF